MKHKKLALIMIIILAVIVVWYIRNSYNVISDTLKESISDNIVTVIVDAGHGGFDPGKVGIDGTLEKDINLKIAHKLKEKLEQKGVRVILTRDSDKGLYNESSRQKKKEDLMNRMNIINKNDAILAISIHQNSYTNNSVKGPQVFFYTESDKSRELATYIQDVLNESREDDKREIKANKDYYILKKAEIPLAIVECGFLSNEEEAKLLNSEEYQCKMADDITKGVIMWINDSL